jgi:glycosyltransferase involved in cell wall biosynthesis
VQCFLNKDTRFKFLRQENARQAAAKNLGLRHSSGQYVQFLDADDLIEPEKLEKQVSYLQSHAHIDIVYGSVRYFSSEEPDKWLYTTWGEEKAWMPEVSGRGRDLLAALIDRNIMVINSPLVRRSVIESVGLFDDKLPPAEDWDYWVRCAAVGVTFQYENLPGTLALVRSHTASSSQDRRKMYASMLSIRTKIESLTDDPDLRTINRQHFIKEQESLTFETIMHGPLKDSVREMLRASFNSRTPKHALKWLVCACAAPVVPRRRLAALVTTSLTRPWHNS